MWLLVISHSSVNIDSHRSRENEFITIFIYYMTLCNHVINRLCDFVDNNPPLEPTNLSHSFRGSRNIPVFISQVITWSRGQSVKRLDGWWSFIINLYLSKVGSHSFRGRGDISFFICRVTSCGRVIAGSRTSAGSGPSA